MSNYNSLDDFKKENKILDRTNTEITAIFRKMYGIYIDSNPNEDKIFANKLFEEILEKGKELNPSLIPYSGITNIIFSSQIYYEEQENKFTEKFKSEFEKYLIERYDNNFKKEHEHSIETDDLYVDNSTKSKIKISKEEATGIIIVYKIIQHAELAISQKESLYETQRDDIYSLSHDINEASNKYNNMISNFISILGIFSAIMMSSFGVIQGFTAIYTNENNYGLSEIFIISSFILFALLSVIYLLFYSISKLTGKDLSNGYSQESLIKSHPIYSHSMLITIIIFLFSLTHLFHYRTPNYFPKFLSDNLWAFTILIILTSLVFYYIHRLIDQSYGYWHINRFINDWIMDIKYKKGKRFIILSTIIGVIIIIILILLILFFI